MKLIKYCAMAVALIHFLLLLNCNRDKSIIQSAHSDVEPEYSAFQYFPIEVGNIWNYNNYSNRFDTSAVKKIKRIQDKYMVKDTTYYLWTTGDGTDLIDTIRVDAVGDIWERVRNRDYLWFKFSEDSDLYYTSTPITHGWDVFFYMVKVKRNVSIDTPAGRFSDCIKFRFNVPEIFDEEEVYTFAPKIGLVHHEYYANTKYYELTSAIINNVHIGQ
jgi:hypothetical protein